MPYPVTFKADYVEKRSRLTTFFRLILAIPHIIFLYFYGLAAGVVVIIAWFALLFTGRYPPGMYDFVSGSLPQLDLGDPSQSTNGGNATLSTRGAASCDHGPLVSGPPGGIDHACARDRGVPRSSARDRRQRNLRGRARSGHDAVVRRW